MNKISVSSYSASSNTILYPNKLTSDMLIDIIGVDGGTCYVAIKVCKVPSLSDSSGEIDRWGEILDLWPVSCFEFSRNCIHLFKIGQGEKLLVPRGVR